MTRGFVLLFLLSVLVGQAQVSSSDDLIVIRSVFGINAQPRCDTLPRTKILCADKSCMPNLHVGFTRAIKSVLMHTQVTDSVKMFPVMEDYYYGNIDSAKVTFNRLYFYAEAFNTKNVTAKNQPPRELQIVVFYKQRMLVRVIRLNENDTAKADRICRALAAQPEAFYIAANYKTDRFLKVKGE